MMTFNELVDASSVIINGYALQKIEKGVRIVNIHKPTHVCGDVSEMVLPE